jgi:surface antigen
VGTVAPQGNPELRPFLRDHQGEAQMRGIFVVMIAATSLLTACANQPGQAAPGEFGANKTTAGTLLGAGAGGLAGAQFGHGAGKLAAVGAGTLLGAFLGHEAGASLDRADQAYAQRAEQQAYAAPIGQKIVWNNPESGHSGEVVPLRQGTAEDGSYCREYQSKVVVGGKTEEAYGTACRQPDGSWKVVQ